ncbi:PucR family transcriptional regulator [Alkalibacillus haloalkaliphilus]|uniref:PucR family transcriptional regulator n=1 Tax=Alkalibacillus haloalkaliphilus TaxID=94136 RepID=UPI0029362C0A|nr:helix-turn-helix domain-containing protein [Alkalibacillus haloalkaliphilus]MDV2582259.1 helix-turn-helix domain-containing protein [Alkalibacillus haloalkaliphilus]
MIEQLKTLYPNMTQLDQPTDDYITFIVDDSLYGIPKDDLSEESLTLLQTLLPNQVTSEKEQDWIHFLTGQTSEPPERLEAFRVVALYVQSTFEQSLLENTLEDVLGKKLIFIWQNNNLAIVLEPLEIDEAPLQFHEVIDILSNDLEVKLSIFQTETDQAIELLPKLYNWTIQVADKLLKSAHQRVLTQSEALMPTMIESLNEDDRDFFVKAVLNDAINDLDLLKTIQTTIEHQVNISVVAKQLYMHRNTVQKRIEKFYELTGLDVRQFEDALKAYVCIKYLT